MKEHIIRTPKDFVTYYIPLEEFDRLVDSGVEDIIIVTPTRRYVASVEDWQDFGTVLDDSIALSRRGMIRV